MSAADAGDVSVSSALGGVALLGGFDAAVDLLPGLVVVGAEIRLADIVIGVRHFLLIVSELAVSEHGVQDLVDFEACSSGDGGLVDPVPGDRLGEDVGCSFAFVGDDDRSCFVGFENRRILYDVSDDRASRARGTYDDQRF